MSDKADSDPPLPKGWVKTFSNSQKRYYYSHPASKHTQWHFPTASEVADPMKAKQRAEEYKKNEQRKRESSSDHHHRTSGHNKRPRNTPATATAASGGGIDATEDKPCIAIIVPYRDIHPKQQRAKHLKSFIPHMIKFCTNLVKLNKISDYHVYIIEQSNDNRKFNRGKLLNIGFDIAIKKPTKPKHNVFIFHDVDLLPQNDLFDAYSLYPTKPYHIARIWDRYSNNPKYFGGVVSFSLLDYKKINGYPNTFWGWGGEDDEMQLRCEKNNIKWDYPKSGTLIDLEQMSLTEKLDFLRQNKEWKCMVKWEALDEHEKTWKTNGLYDLNYSITKTQTLDPPNAKTRQATKITVDVKLNGNHWANEKCDMDFLGDWKKK